MQLTYVDSTMSLTMRFEILVIVFVAFLEKRVVNGMQFLTWFSLFSLGRVIAKFDWLYYIVNSLCITI